MEWLTVILDLRTIFLVSTVIYLICTLLVCQLWTQYRTRFPGIGYLTLNYALQVGGVSLIAARGLVPDFISVILANSLMVVGLAVGYYGFMLFCGKKQTMWVWVVLIVLYTLSQMYLLYVEPSLTWRKVCNSLALTIAGLLTASYLLRKIESPASAFTKQIGWIHVAYAAFFALRIVVVINEPQSTQSIFEQETWDAALSQLYPAFFVLLTFAVSMMINLRLNWETEQAKAETKVLSGLLPICAWCKNVRDDRGYWSQIESYISENSEADFSHGICPDCAAGVLAAAESE